MISDLILFKITIQSLKFVSHETVISNIENTKLA